MPRVNPDNLYASFTFISDAEALHASQFSELQLTKLYNLRTRAATGKANAACEPGQEQAYLWRQEFFRGQIEILSELIDDHEFATTKLTQISTQQEEG